MDSTKVGPGIAAGLQGNSAVQKSKKAQREGDKVVEKSGGDEKGDFNVSLSPKSREIAEARKLALGIAKNTPDIREDKVEEFKRRIDSGEYKADAGNIADGMLREAVRDELARNPPEF